MVKVLQNSKFNFPNHFHQHPHELCHSNYRSSGSCRYHWRVFCLSHVPWYLFWPGCILLETLRFVQPPEISRYSSSCKVGLVISSQIPFHIIYVYRCVDTLKMVWKYLEVLTEVYTDPASYLSNVSVE